MLASTVGSAGLRVGIDRLGVGIVEVQSTTVKLKALHSLISLGGRLGVVEVDVTEASAAAGHLLGDNTSASKTLELLESLIQSIVINVPAKASSKKSGSSLSAAGLGLLSRLVDVLLSLALLGRSLSLLLLDLLRVRVARAIGVAVRVVRVRVGVGGLDIWLADMQ